jgi:hypothetical protein
MNLSLHKDEVLKGLMSDYKQDVHRFWSRQFPPLAIPGIVVIFSLCYLFTQYVGDAQMASLAWWQISIVLWFAVMAMPFYLMYPRKPTEHDVKMTILFRAHAGKKNDSN